MLIHPYVTEERLRQREQELRKSARQHAPGQPRPRHRASRRSVRRRAGWVLIEVGLALVQGAAMPGTPPRHSSARQTS